MDDRALRIDVRVRDENRNRYGFMVLLDALPREPREYLNTPMVSVRLSMVDPRDPVIRERKP